MKISIITICYNSEKTVADALESVLSQKGVDLEYIIIDGASKDKTMETVNKYKDKISKIVSEPDKGIYNAMNKGVRMATGDIVGILNSDDFYHNESALKKVAECFEKNDIDACYGNLRYVDREDKNKQTRFWKAGAFKESKLKRGWIPPHPAFFVKKEIYEKYGYFNEDFKIAADYELMLRFLKKGIKIKYLNETLATMREGGESAADLKNRKKGWAEIKKAWSVNGWKTPCCLILLRVLSKIWQFFR